MSKTDSFHPEFYKIERITDHHNGQEPSATRNAWVRVEISFAEFEKAPIIRFDRGLLWALRFSYVAACFGEEYE